MGFEVVKGKTSHLSQLNLLFTIRRFFFLYSAFNGRRAVVTNCDYSLGSSPVKENIGKYYRSVADFTLFSFQGGSLLDLYSPNYKELGR